MKTGISPGLNRVTGTGTEVEVILGSTPFLSWVLVTWHPLFWVSVALPATTNGYTSVPTVSIFGGGNVTTTATLGILVNTISPIQNYPLGTFQTLPTISFNGGGVINITATLTGQAITSFTITNGGYTG
jgi:hypothetical protein